MTPTQLLNYISSLPPKSNIKIPCKSFAQMEALRATFYRLKQSSLSQFSNISISRSIHPTYTIILYHGPKPPTQLSDFQVNIHNSNSQQSTQVSHKV